MSAPAAPTLPEMLTLLVSELKVSSAARKIPVERRGVGRVPGAQGQCQGQAYPGGGGQAYRQPRAAALDVLLDDRRLAAGVFNSGILADPRPVRRMTTRQRPAGLLDRAQRIRIVCARYGVPIVAAAIRFVLRHPAVTAVVVGARDATEVIEDASCLTAAVPAELFDELAAEHLIPIASTT